MFKTTGFREILENTLKLCEDNDFPLRKVGRGRGNKDSIFDENEYLVKFNKIVDRFIDDISDRFDKTNYMAACELYKLFNNKKEQYTINFQEIRVYQNILDFDQLKLQTEAFNIYKKQQTGVNWENFNELCNSFCISKLENFFPQIFRALKIYLSIPIGTQTAVRSFSCLKLIKTWLRSVMLNERLSDLYIIKMLKDSKFELNYDNVVKDFNALAQRTLNLE